MRCLLKNAQTVYYRVFDSVSETTDSTTYYETITEREKTFAYGSLASMMANVSPASGEATMWGNGIHTDYTHNMVTDAMTCPITIDSLIWVGVTPTASSVDANYRVVSVEKSLNHITYRLKEMSGE